MITFIGKNQHGYYSCSDDVSCTLLATLNLLISGYSIHDSNFHDSVIHNFGELRQQDPTQSFVHPLMIPRTIEAITNNHFRGILMAPRARESMLQLGEKDVSRYALNTNKVDYRSTPFIHSIVTGEHACHALAIPKYDPVRGFLIIDNGVPSFNEKIGTGLAAYKLVKN